MTVRTEFRRLLGRFAGGSLSCRSGRDGEILDKKGKNVMRGQER